LKKGLLYSQREHRILDLLLSKPFISDCPSSKSQVLLPQSRDLEDTKCPGSAAIRETPDESPSE
jgi:hypothetical protein